MYFLQYEGEPKEYSPSFVFDSDKCFSKIVPALPDTSPVSSITTTWTSSNFESRAAEKLDVPGRSDMLFQLIDELVNWIVCESNQSVLEVGVALT